MFGVGLPEFLLILAVAVVVIGPQDLPKALYTAGKLFRKFKTITADIQKSVDAVLHEEELADIAREANKPGGENLQFEIEKQIQIEHEKKSATG